MPLNVYCQRGKTGTKRLVRNSDYGIAEVQAAASPVAPQAQTPTRHFMNLSVLCLGLFIPFNLFW